MRSTLQICVSVGVAVALGVVIDCRAASPPPGAKTEQVVQDASCERLKAVVIPDVAIRVAQMVAAGAAAAVPEIAEHTKVQIPSAALPHLAKAPAFCRVAGSIKPTTDSDVKFEVWMPASGWNGKFQGLGEGGFAGFIDYRGLAISLNRGYATASTDTGHNVRDDMSATVWAFKQPEKIKDFDYRGVHVMTVAAKSIVSAFYGKPSRHSYFSGCSGGGHQALMEAQRYPQDYDGILAGAPANYVPDIARIVWLEQGMARDPATVLSVKKLPALHSAAVQACDELDGLKDGIISDPFHCHFDPAVLQCKGVETDQCLTTPQIETARKFYAALKGPDGKSLHNNRLPGSESEWAWYLAPTPAQSLMGVLGNGWYRNFVFGDPDWTPEKFDLERDLKTDLEKFGPDIIAGNPDLSPFEARGGKLIIYQGMTDAAVAADGVIDYVHRVEATMSRARARATVMLFLVPGMNHCMGGDGPSEFNGGNGAKSPEDPQHDISAALERWVETNAAPQKIIASQYAPPSGMDGPAADSVLVRSRPVCPFPATARWTGKGSIDDAAKFECQNQMSH